MNLRHVPVLLSEVIEFWIPKRDLGSHAQHYLDVTLGGAGHSAKLLQTLIAQTFDNDAKPVFLWGMDQDRVALERAHTTLQALALPQSVQVQTAQYNFKNLTQAVQALTIPLIDGGILADIGVSSFQLDEAERGFSFGKPAALDMRMDPSQGMSASDWINSASHSELQKVFSGYGEERLSGSIAQRIVEERKTTAITRTDQLADLVRQVYQKTLPGVLREKTLHPATQVFQAIRIHVNDELGALEAFLPQAVQQLAPGGRLLIISFHSLEDRIVKRFFQDESRDCICPPRLPACQCAHRARFKLLTPKPLTPTSEELAMNLRSRSARLRVAERL